MTRTWLEILCVGLLVLAGCFGDGPVTNEDGSEDGDTGNVQADAVADGGSPSMPVERDPVVAEPQRVTAREFFSAYKDDEATAVAKYRQGPIELTGIVKSVDRGSYFDEGLKPYLNIVGIENYDPDKVFDRRECTDLVICYLDEPNDPWNAVSSGSTVTIRGVLLDPSGREAPKSMIGHGEIVSSEGAPVPQFSVDQFAAECNQDRNAAESKYQWKSIIIKGRVEAIENLASGGVRGLTLQGSVEERIQVTISLGASNETRVAVGESVAVLGICTTRFSDPDQFATLIASTLLAPSQTE